jgi:hypothetical protein
MFLRLRQQAAALREPPPGFLASGCFFDGRGQHFPARGSKLPQSPGRQQAAALRRPPPARVTIFVAMIIDVVGAGLLLVAGWFWLKSVRAIVRGLGSKSWPAASGVIKSAEVVKKRNSKSREVWRQKIEYSYSVGNARYRGTRIQFGIPNALRWRNPVVDSFRVFRRKEAVDVFYSPSRPSIASLERGYSPFVFVTLAAGAVIIWMGLGLITLPG